MTDDNPLGWLALGAGLASAEARGRLLAIAKPPEWEGRHGGELLAALGGNRPQMAETLIKLFRIELGITQTAANAVLDAVAYRVQVKKQMRLAKNIEAAARMLSPDQFRKWLDEQRASLAKPTASLSDAS